ncbi:MAG: NosD domain-containing protein, partial [Planctomycetota bacterium]
MAAVPGLFSALPAQTRHASRALQILVTEDDTVLTRSCRIRIPKGTVIRDRNGNGVLQVRANNIDIVFAPGSVLRGAKPGTPPDEFTGVGIRLNGHKGVSIQDARVHGYKVGMHLSRANGLAVVGCDVSDNYRQRLRSTPQAEDTVDWLRPHDNDDHQWLGSYGAGICVERSKRVHVRKNRARRGQNGIVLDRVEDSFVYDNDCSFLSGWGLALWRSCGNTVTHNAFDFCIRGYSHGVYNRGQDSAGILMFEQCSRNVIAENSATHGGDGLFGHAGSEALGQTAPKSQNFDYQRCGNNDNLIVANDLSYAAAHGLEMTFSFGNRIYLNRLVGNAICGIWAGYSQDTWVGRNTIRSNGERGYGLERGGINIEHGAGNLIHDNEFAANKCGVHLWDDDDRGLLKLPWARANHRGCVDNYVICNQFDGDVVALHLRAARRTWFSRNKLLRVETDVLATAGAEPNRQLKKDPAWRLPTYKGLGRCEPVGARKHLRGRDKIILDAWGPWDHEQPMVRWAGVVAGAHRYEVFGVTGKLTARLVAGREQGVRLRRRPAWIEVSSDKSGVLPYVL